MPYRHLGEDSSRKNRKLKALDQEKTGVFEDQQEGQCGRSKETEAEGGRDEARKALRVQHIQDLAGHGKDFAFHSQMRWFWTEKWHDMS